MFWVAVILRLKFGWMVWNIPLIKDFRLNVSGTFRALFGQKKVPGRAKNCPAKIEKAPFVKIFKKNYFWSIYAVFSRLWSFLTLLQQRQVI